jgi:hypothetical protein
MINLEELRYGIGSREEKLSNKFLLFFFLVQGKRNLPIRKRVDISEIDPIISVHLIYDKSYITQ